VGTSLEAQEKVFKGIRCCRGIIHVVGFRVALKVTCVAFMDTRRYDRCLVCLFFEMRKLCFIFIYLFLSSYR